MKYYYHPLSPNCRKVTALIEMLGQKCERKVIDLPKGEHLTPEFLEVNPFGAVPVLVDGELKLPESNAILIYLAEKAGSELWPSASRSAAGGSRATHWPTWVCCSTVWERTRPPGSTANGR